MLRVLARLALLLVGVTSASLLLIRAPGYDDSAIQRFFAASCTPMPCWQGIRPGETTTTEALDRLRAHPWVGTVSEVYASPYEGNTRTVLIYWTWSSSYPFAGDAPETQQGIIITNEGIVQQIFLTTSLALGDIWLAFGSPDSGLIDYTYDTHHLRMDNTSLFARDGVAATASVLTDCTEDYPDFWHVPVYMWLQSSASLSNYNMAYSTYTTMMHRGYHQVLASLC